MDQYRRNILKKKFLGITEYLSKKTTSKNEVMLFIIIIFLYLPKPYPSQKCFKKYFKKNIFNNVIKINNFYQNVLNKKARLAVLGLNLTETINKYSEEEKL